MSKVFRKLSDIKRKKKNFAYFTSSHDKEVNQGEQNHQDQIVLIIFASFSEFAGNTDFLFFLHATIQSKFMCPKLGIN